MCQCMTWAESNQIRTPWGNIVHVSLVFFPPFLQDDLLLHSGSVLLEYLLLISMHALVQWCSRRCMFNYFPKVSHYNVGCCASLYGLLWTQQGSISTQEFVKRTDRVPLMSALLLFNITTEHTLNSRHGAVPFDM